MTASSSRSTGGSSWRPASLRGRTCTLSATQRQQLIGALTALRATPVNATDLSTDGAVPIPPADDSGDGESEPITLAVTDDLARSFDLTDPSLGGVSDLVGAVVIDVTLTSPASAKCTTSTTRADRRRGRRLTHQPSAAAPRPQPGAGILPATRQRPVCRPAFRRAKPRRRLGAARPRGRRACRRRPRRGRCQTPRPVAARPRGRACCVRRGRPGGRSRRRARRVARPSRAS